MNEYINKDIQSQGPEFIIFASHEIEIEQDPVIQGALCVTRLPVLPKRLSGTEIAVGFVVSVLANVTTPMLLNAVKAIIASVIKKTSCTQPGPQAINIQIAIKGHVLKVEGDNVDSLTARVGDALISWGKQ